MNEQELQDESGVITVGGFVQLVGVWWRDIYTEIERHAVYRVVSRMSSFLLPLDFVYTWKQ